MGLDGAYWVRNLVQPVLLFEAVTSSVQGNGGSFTIAIEVGPHGALRGPVNQTLKQASMPYTSCLSRGQNAMETFSEALTALWTSSPTSVQLSGWRTALALKPIIPLSDLPPYAWDHTQTHWRESRVSRSFRLNPQPTHDLLGRLWQDTGSEHTWRNTLRLEEMPWLRGHQSQILFPATGYISLAVDAAKAFAKGQGHSVKLLEVRDMTIPTALPINEGDEVEILFIIRTRGPGQLTIHLGDPATTDLPPTSISKIELTPCNVDRFYQAASEIGFAYSGPFRGLETLNRCWGHAKGLAVWGGEDPDMQIACTLHPAITDVAFQTGLSTILSMAERSTHSPYLPVGIKRAVIDPNRAFGAGSQVTIEAYLTSPTVGLGPRIETDIRVKSTGDLSTGEVCEIQLKDVAFKALSEQLPSEDRNMYAKTVWGHDAAYGLSLPSVSTVVDKSRSAYTAADYERVAFFHLRRLSESVTPQDMHGLQPHHQRLVRCVNAITANIRADTNRRFLKAEWLLDTPETITDLVSRNPGDSDMAALVSSAGRTQSLLNGRSSGQKPNFSVYQALTRRGTGCGQAIAQLVAQISHTFPRANILHLCGDAGAGTVDAVTGILDSVGDAYSAYTCANLSQSVVDELKNNDRLAAALDTGRFSLDVFNLETEDAVTPGRKQELYDVIIITDLCRARKDLSESVRRLRRLLRPGGFLVSMELTGLSLVPMAMLGGVEGWWENGDNASCPAIKTGELDNLLSNNGFFGIDTIFYDRPSQNIHGYSVLAAQAMDDRLAVLRSPLTALHTIPATNQVGFDYMANVSPSGPVGADSTIGLEDADFTTVYDLVLDIQPSVDGKGGHILGITCSDDYYSRSATEFLAETFVNVLQGLVEQPLSLVRGLKLFSDAQLDNSRAVARSTPPLSHPWPESLVERFAQVVAQFPDSVAITDGDASITYSQLKDKVELYAGILLAADARGGTSRVAVLCKPSIDLYAVMLAVYWIGAVFVPLDASVPAARRNDMIRACQPRVLVFHPATADEVAEKHLHLDTGSQLNLVNITMLARTHRQVFPPSMVPKGIRLHKRGIMNFAAAVTKRYNLGQVRVLQQTSIGFVVGFSQIYTALANGGTLVVAPLEARGDPDRLSRLILDNKVQWTMCTPSEYSLMLTYAADRLRQCTEWRFAGAGGEVLPDRVVDGLRELGLPHLLLTNWYGPTEVTVITAQDIPLIKRVSAESNESDNGNRLGSTIGRVLPNKAIYIASENDGSLLPLGMPGEICVAGNMVANGYLDPKFNQDTFITNPFTTTTTNTDDKY
ncbi:hypothetical protein BJY00DRAFT_314725 [Aspergillus carlsbadensis]|nr:hypothetical protein BJY00DRAFT_314725 [Aspergillus carlsbadensis]